MRAGVVGLLLFHLLLLRGGIVDGEVEVNAFCLFGSGRSGLLVDDIPFDLFLYLLSVLEIWHSGAM